MKAIWTAIAVCAMAQAASAERVRCTAADKSYSYFRQAPCPVATDVQTPVSATKPLMARDPANREPVKCTSRDGKRQTIEVGNCADPNAYQQRVIDR